MEQPIVSIVLTTYNSERTILSVLNSIVKQEFPLNKVELIIVDGGSKDNTLKIVQEFLKENSERFYRVELIVHDKNYGVSKARNDGIKASRGQYLLILDHDVVMEENTLKSLVEYLKKSPEKVCCVQPLLQWEEGGLFNKWRERIFENRVTKGDSIADCTLIKRGIIDKVGYYNETLGPPHTDTFEEREYGARVEAKGYEIHVLGWIKVKNYNIGMDPIKYNVSKHPKNVELVLLKIVRAFSSLFDYKYRLGLKRWVISMPFLKKLRWIAYSTIIPMLVLTWFISVFFRTTSPLVALFLALFILYLDVLRQHWNPKILHISLAYSAIALAWRIVRGSTLLIPLKYSIRNN